MKTSKYQQNVDKTTKKEISTTYVNKLRARAHNMALNALIIEKKFNIKKSK